MEPTNRSASQAQSGSTSPRSSARRARWNRCAATTAIFVALSLSFAGVARADDPKAGKSAEDILNGLLDGGNRGVGGVRPEGQGGKPAEGGGGGRVALPIQFEYNSATISESSLSQLASVVEALKDERLRSSHILLEGHTDNVGSPDYNLGLSKRRAEAVEKYLSDQGIDSSRLSAKGLGQSRPLPGVPADTEEGRAQQRRVEFVNLGTGKAAAKAAKAEAKADVKPAVAKKATDSKLAVKVLVNYQQGGAQHTLTPGTVLRPDDNFRITFTPNRSSYVYVYHLDNQGKVQPIFPNPKLSKNENPVSASSTQVIPPEGQWLGVGKDPGQEQIVVLASQEPIADAQSLATRIARGEATAPEMRMAMRGPAAAPRGDVLAEPPADMFSYRLPFTHQ